MPIGVHGESSIYDLSSGTYFLGGPPHVDDFSRSLKFAKLPSEAGQKNAWSEIRLSKSIIDFGTSLDENDLVAFVTSTLSPNLMEYYIDIDLYQLSTGQAHPDAQQPHFRVQQAHMSLGRPLVSIEVVGDVLAVITHYDPDDDEGDPDNALHNRLSLFAWKTGVPINPGGHQVWNLGLCFLTPQLLLHPNEHSRALYVLRIPDAPTSASQLSLVCELRYPRFRSGLAITNTVCRGEPNPVGNRFKQDATRPFRSRAEDAIIIVDMALDFGDEMVEIFALVVHRSTVLRHASRAEGGTSSIPWEDWGPTGARWFGTTEMNSGFVTVSSGQRFVQMPSVTALGPTKQSIHVLDFNPCTVRRVEAEIVARGGDAGEDPYRGLAIDTPTATIVLPCDHRPGQPWTRSRDPPSVSKTSSSDSSDSDSDLLDDEDAHPYIRLPTHVYGPLIHPAEVSTNMNIVFAKAETLQPGLPFVRTITKQQYLYESVLMDDERIIGLSTVDQMDSLHTFYIG
ncbi:hypothetical protein BD626DRAFT_562684 [Schizophyllum amplum]|uniref:Uncharacterized protein n=1 Tax=Schizophyllum amplum TaxID=97359 RepID=A0A550CVP5_9AGAR|nr:hypothetical protein BD626DRAFT_562684 [Auriculariopsis ampla]